MTTINKTYIVTVLGHEGDDHDISVTLEAPVTNSMFDDAPIAFRRAQEIHAQGIAQSYSKSSGEPYDQVLAGYMAQISLHIIRKEGATRRYFFSGYLDHEQDCDRPTENHVLAVDDDEAEFQARWEIANDNGYDPVIELNSFFEAFPRVVLDLCTEAPVTGDDLANAVGDFLDAEEKGTGTYAAIERLRVLHIHYRQNTIPTTL